MKIAKHGRFFRILGLLALVFVIGVMFTGCELIVGGGMIIGGIFRGILGSSSESGVVFGWIGVIVGCIIIIRFIIKLMIYDESSNSGSSGSRTSVSSHMENRINYPNKCISCTYYLSRGVCRRNDKPVSEMDSCSDWC